MFNTIYVPYMKHLMVLAYTQQRGEKLFRFCFSLFKWRVEVNCIQVSWNLYDKIVSIMQFYIGFDWSTEESDLKSFQHGVERGWFVVIAMSNNMIIVESVLYELYWHSEYLGCYPFALFNDLFTYQKGNVLYEKDSILT